MFKSILATSVALICGGSAAAVPLDPAFGVGSISRGEAYAIRSCGDAYGPRVDVCYNQDTSGQVFPFSRGVGLTIERTRVVRVACDRRHAADTTRGEVAAAYCPQVEAGTLAPAPFLS